MFDCSYCAKKFLFGEDICKICSWALKNREASVIYEELPCTGDVYPLDCKTCLLDPWCKHWDAPALS